MNFEREQLKCGCEIYRSSRTPIEICEEAQTLTRHLLTAVEKAWPPASPENPEHVAEAQEVDSRLSAHFSEQMED